MGVAFDSPNLYLKLTAKENLQLMASYYRKETHEIEPLLDKVGLLKDKDKKVEGYSRGMKIRLNFVRSILHDPELIFLDEPTAGLDPVNAKVIKDIILDLKSKGKTIFLTTHNMDVADSLCDHLAFIVEGKIPIIDTPKDLKMNYGKNSVIVEYVQKHEVYKSEFDLKKINNDAYFLDIIKNKEIKTIHSQEATLEDIFIQVTGKELL